MILQEKQKKTKFSFISPSPPRNIQKYSERGHLKITDILFTVMRRKTDGNRYDKGQEGSVTLIGQGIGK